MSDEPDMNRARIKGIRHRLSPARKFVGDLVYYARKIPSVRVSRTINIARVAEAREQAVPRPCWTAVFMKAYAIVARRHSFLRQVFMRWPWLYLYEHPFSICALMIERKYQGEWAVLGTKIRAPETSTLVDITRHIDRYKTEPVESFGRYRLALRSGILPLTIRRLYWWLILNVSGHKRCKRLGTFGLTSVGALGADLDPIGPASSILTFGPIESDGDVRLQIVFDHRVMDGGNVARCLAEMVQVLHQDIMNELLGIPSETPCSDHDLKLN